VRNLSIAIVLFGLLSIWAEELRTLAVSLIAFAVAAVIATKELILCASGPLVRAAGDADGIGDRIEIARAAFLAARAWGAGATGVSREPP
jgi:hypothetical protein